MEGKNAIGFPGFYRETIDVVLVLNENSIKQLTGLFRQLPIGNYRLFAGREGKVSRAATETFGRIGMAKQAIYCGGKVSFFACWFVRKAKFRILDIAYTECNTINCR